MCICRELTYYVTREEGIDVFAIAGVLCFIIGWGYAFPMIVGAIAFWGAGVTSNYQMMGEHPPGIAVVAKYAFGPLAAIIVVVSFLAS
jgi:hypothetical protein